MWAELKRIIKPNGAIVLFGAQPFTTTLIASNMKMFKYCWVWNKVRGTNFFAAKYQPLNNTEDIVVFSTGGCNNGTKNPVPYYPQGLYSCEKMNKYGGGKIGAEHGAVEKQYLQKETGYPFKILEFSYEKRTVHPTQKPVALLEYLVRTYTKEGETVLDFTAGSMSTAIACINTNRKGIMIEKDEYYFKVGSDRVAQALQEQDNDNI